MGAGPKRGLPDEAGSAARQVHKRSGDPILKRRAAKKKRRSCHVHRRIKSMRSSGARQPNPQGVKSHEASTGEGGLQPEQGHAPAPRTPIHAQCIRFQSAAPPAPFPVPLPVPRPAPRSPPRSHACFSASFKARSDRLSEQSREAPPPRHRTAPSHPRTARRRPRGPAAPPDRPRGRKARTVERGTR